MRSSIQLVKCVDGNTNDICEELLGLVARVVSIVAALSLQPVA
jgi:hypothetical protein